MAVITLEDFFDDCPAMLFVAHDDGSIILVSTALEQRLGHRFDQARSLAALAEPEDAAVVAALLASLESEARHEAECFVRSAEADGTAIDLRCIVRRGSDGVLLGRLEVTPVASRPSPEQLERLMLRTILDNLDISIWAIDQHGRYVLQDGKALASTGLVPNQLCGMSVFELSPMEAEQWVVRPLAGERVQGHAEYGGAHWQTWAVPLKLDDETTWCAGISLDVTERIEAQRGLEQQLEIVSSQQAAISKLSAPVLRVWDRVLAVPLIGLMDSRRTDELTERLLDAAHRSQTRFAILDLTGVEAVDASIAAHVLRLLRSLELLGVHGLVTGVSPDVARTMVEVGAELESVQIHRSLREGLHHCMRQLRDA